MTMLERGIGRDTDIGGKEGLTRSNRIISPNRLGRKGEHQARSFKAFASHIRSIRGNINISLPGACCHTKGKLPASASLSIDSP